MPIYEFWCPQHEHFEAWQGIHDEPLKACPDCGQPVEKLISLPGGFVLEPKGHYIPAPGRDKKGRMNEVKISPQESERQDRARRDAMLATRARAIKQGQKLVIDP
jgi:putative FmdB family regulatory protein